MDNAFDPTSLISTYMGKWVEVKNKISGMFCHGTVVSMEFTSALPKKDEVMLCVSYEQGKIYVSLAEVKSGPYIECPPLSVATQFAQKWGIINKNAIKELEGLLEKTALNNAGLFENK